MNSRKIIVLLIFSVITIATYSQNRKSNTDPLYINILINDNKICYVENDQTDLSKIQAKISELLKKEKFQTDRKIVCQIFADENLKMGLIIDVTSDLHKMNIPDMLVKRYLLNTTNFELDGENWMNKVKNIPKQKG